MRPAKNILEALGTAIVSLRERLRLTQLQLSQRLGGFDPEYVRRWEKGEVAPSGAIMVALLRLCPDEQTRQNFFLAIPEGASIIPSPPRSEVSKQEEEAQPGATLKDGRRIRGKHSRPRSE